MHNCATRWYTVVDEMSVDELSWNRLENILQDQKLNIVFSISKWKSGESYSPAAVPQLGGTHQAEEKTFSTTSGKSVTWRWTCKRFRTRAKNIPTRKSRKPRRNSR